MKITLVAHACVLIETRTAGILTDPWFFGTAFNDSWKLLPTVAWRPELLERVTHLWLSHEHPDHFHVPTLRGFPEEFRKRVTVLFKDDNSDKVPGALRAMGYSTIVRLPHRRKVRLAGETQVLCYQVGFVDSCLAVWDGNEAPLLNINDAPFGKRDGVILLKELGRVGLVLNQFSMASYNGNIDWETQLARDRQVMLSRVLENHQSVRAKATIPFASYMYYCRSDNAYMNRFKVSPKDVRDFLAAHGERAYVLYFGHSLDSEQDYAGTEGCIKLFEEEYSRIKLEMPASDPPVSLEEILKSGCGLVDALYLRYPALILKMMGTLTFYIRDLGKAVEFSLPHKRVREIEASEQECDVSVNSQPLDYFFRFTWGGQTLTVSARYSIRRKFPIWLRHRVLLALNNAELYLKLKYVFSLRQMNFYARRLPGLIRQITVQLSLVRN